MVEFGCQKLSIKAIFQTHLILIDNQKTAHALISLHTINCVVMSILRIGVFILQVLILDRFVRSMSQMKPYTSLIPDK